MTTVGMRRQNRGEGERPLLMELAEAAYGRNRAAKGAVRALGRPPAVGVRSLGFE